MVSAMFAGIGLFLLAAGVAAEPVKNGFDLGGAVIPADAIVPGGPPRDGIPAIDAPKWVSRAYPIAILNWHEIVNDRVGDELVAISYCPLCGSGVAYVAKLQVPPSRAPFLTSRFARISGGY